MMMHDTIRNPQVTATPALRNLITQTAIASSKIVQAYHTLQLSTGQHTLSCKLQLSTGQHTLSCKLAKLHTVHSYHNCKGEIFGKLPTKCPMSCLMIAVARNFELRRIQTGPLSLSRFIISVMAVEEGRKEGVCMCAGASA